MSLSLQIDTFISLDAVFAQPQLSVRQSTMVHVNSLTHLKLLLLPLPLLGCISAEESCVRSATAEYRVIDALYEETQANIERGYGLETVDDVVNRLVPCVKNGKRGFCQEPTLRKRQEAVAINVEDERRILSQLQITRAKAGREADRAVSECRKLGS